MVCRYVYFNQSDGEVGRGGEACGRVSGRQHRSEAKPGVFPMAYNDEAEEHFQHGEDSCEPQHSIGQQRVERGYNAIGTGSGVGDVGSVGDGCVGSIGDGCGGGGVGVVELGVAEVG